MVRRCRAAQVIVPHSIAMAVRVRREAVREVAASVRVPMVRVVVRPVRVDRVRAAQVAVRQVRVVQVVRWDVRVLE